MKKKLFLCPAVVLLISWTGIGIAQQGNIPPAIWEKAQTEGVVRVVVGLDLSWTPEWGLGSEEAVLAQLQAIAASQDELLAELAGTEHRVTRRSENMRTLALEVGLGALTVLERSTLVIWVREEDSDHSH